MVPLSAARAPGPAGIRPGSESRGSAAGPGILLGALTLTPAIGPLRDCLQDGHGKSNGNGRGPGPYIKGVPPTEQAKRAARSLSQPRPGRSILMPRISACLVALAVQGHRPGQPALDTSLKRSDANCIATLTFEGAAARSSAISQRMCAQCGRVAARKAFG